MKNFICAVCVVALLAGCGGKEKEVAKKEAVEKTEVNRTELSKQLLVQGIAALQEGNAVKAIKSLQASVISDPQNYDAHITLAQTYLQLEQFEQASDLLKQTTEMFPEKAMPYYMFAVVSMQLGNDIRAAVSVKRSLDLFQKEQAGKEQIARAAGLLTHLIEKNNASEDSN